MRKAAITFAVLVLIVTVAFAAGKAVKKDTTSKEATQNKSVVTEDIKVTFIELGSVNCVPCRMMQPVMNEVRTKYKGQVNVVFHDVWTAEGQPFGEKYGIRAIPTQVFLDKDGKEFNRHVGFFPFDELEQVLKLKGVKQP